MEASTISEPTARRRTSVTGYGQVRMSGFDYILVSEDDDEDAEVWIMKDVSGAEEDDAAYVPVEDEDEISAILPLFEEMFDEEDTEEE